MTGRPGDAGMDEIAYVVGDATRPPADGNTIIAHVCNDTGGWGRGFVVALSERWPESERSYRRWYAERATNDFGLGALRLVAVGSGLWVANMIGQRGIRRSGGRPPIRYDAVEQALTKLAAEAQSLDASVHMPRIGCGLAGGSWDQIEPLLETTLIARGISVTVYDLG